MRSILLLLFLLTLSRAVKVGDDAKSVVNKASSTKAPFEEVETSVINVTSLPAQSSISPESSTAASISVFSDSGVILNTTKDNESEKSNVKPRKGVYFDPSITTETSSNKTNNDVVTPTADKNDTSYKVSEKVNDIANKNPPQLLNENSTILASVPIFHPIGNFSAKGEATEVTAAPPKEKPKKPLHTVSAVDDPTIEKYASKPHSSPDQSHVPSMNIHVVEEPVPAMSQELIPEDQPSFDGYFGYVIISAVVLVFIAIPIVFGRKIKDHWNTRHYRRVDFLVDGMYND